MANHAADRGRALALLRIRGASQHDVRRFIVATLLSPAMLGLVLGAVAAVLEGYGLADFMLEAARRSGRSCNCSRRTSCFRRSPAACGFCSWCCSLWGVLGVQLVCV